MTLVTNLVEQIALARNHHDDDEHHQGGRNAGNKLSLTKQSAQEVIRSVCHLS